MEQLGERKIDEMCCQGGGGAGRRRWTGKAQWRQPKAGWGFGSSPPLGTKGTKFGI